MTKPAPKILILGRPNVGKSTLINQIIKKKLAITDNMPGVTRDIAYIPANWKGKSFYLIDSAGVFFSTKKDIYLQEEAEQRVREMIELADKVVFVVDVITGLHSIDQSIADILRSYTEKVVLVVNKVDSNKREAEAASFFKLGFGEPLFVSAIQGRGISVLLDRATSNIATVSENLRELHHSSYRISFIGRPNVGKSSLLNAIINEDRMIVDDVAGTTRDSVEVFFEYQDNKYVFVDTAGLRRKSRIKDDIEFYSVVRSNKSIKTADLVVVLLDATDFLTDQDKRIINMVLEENKNLIIFVNKWDLTDRSDHERRRLVKAARYTFPPLNNFPFIFGSATERLNFGKLFNLIPEIIANGEKRITTGELNRFVQEVVGRTPPNSKRGKHVKIFYCTQAENTPPIFIFFVNQIGFIEDGYVRYLERSIRSFFNCFEGNPIRIFFKMRGAKQS
jgi:GTPase